MRSVRIRDSATAYLFLAPSLIGLLLFRLYPILLGILESFFQTNYGSVVQHSFVGLQNYKNLLSDFVFWTSLRVTLIFNLVINPFQVLLAFALALLLNRQARGVRLVLSLYLLPVGVSLPIATVIWALMMNPGQGLINGLLNSVGLPPQPFFTSPEQALWSVMVIASWIGVPYWTIFLLAGLKDIPQQYYEAARMDGASWVRELVSITFPLMRRPLAFVTVADTISNFLLFVPMYVLTRGGPQLSTNVLMYEAFRSGFIYQDMGRAMAIVTFLTLIILLVVGAQFRLLTEQEG